MVATKQLGEASAPVVGMLTAASPEGFAAVIAKANEVHARGYMLVGVTPVSGGQLGAVFVRHRPPPSASMANPLLDE